MKKTKNMKLTVTHVIKPKQLRDTLVMTGREYIKTPEYQEKAMKQWKEFINNFKKSPQFEQFERMTAMINEEAKRFNESGIPRMLEEIGRSYTSIMENYKPLLKDEFTTTSPPLAKTLPLTSAFDRYQTWPPELINAIAEKSAEKVIEIMKEKTIATQSIRKKIKPLDIPLETKWENIQARIINEDNVLILIGNRKYETDYKKMGLNDCRTGKPNKQWMFLWFLAVNDGSISWGDYKRNHCLQGISLNDINKFKKTKQLLAKTLKNYFKIDDDPFYPYKKEKAYRIRINLIGELPR